MRCWRRYSGSRLLETRNRQESWEVTLYTLLPRVLHGFLWCKTAAFIDHQNRRRLVFCDYTAANISQMDQADDNSLTALPTKRGQVRFCEIVNTCTERREEKRIQRTAWILSHVLRKTLCEHGNGLCPAGWLNEQSITKHWFQSVRTCPYSWANGRNNIRHQKFIWEHDTWCHVNISEAATLLSMFSKIGCSLEVAAAEVQTKLKFRAPAPAASIQNFSLRLQNELVH